MDARGNATGLDWAGLFQRVFDASPEPVATVAGDGHIVHFVNPAFCLLIGKSKEELIGNAFREVVPAGDDCLALLDRVSQTRQSEAHIGEQHASPHGVYWSYVMWPVLAGEGSPVEIVIAVIETASSHEQVAAVNQKLLVSAMRQHELTDAAEGLNVELRRANEDRKQFASAVSHDLQEPLRTISIYSELLIKGYRGRIDAEASALMSFIAKSAEQMQHLLADLLAYTTLGEEMSDAVVPIHLNSVVQNVIETLKAVIDENSAIVTHGDLPVVRGHAAHFEQLFRNLISNAMKYRGTSSPEIRISAEEISAADTTEPRSEWRFAVADNGVGISPQHHARVFEAFKRLHGKSIPGTGMGLAICKRVVERYGGRIWVESQPDQGSTFYFTLPVMRAGELKEHRKTKASLAS